MSLFRFLLPLAQLSPPLADLVNPLMGTGLEAWILDRQRLPGHCPAWGVNC